jgi:type I restriction enzyme S subunit
MSYFAHSDELPGWAAQVPDRWGTAWLKWSVDLSTKRPTESEQESLPYISNEDVASWTGKLLTEEPKPAEADSRVFQKDDVLFNKLRPYLAKVYHATFDGVSSGELLCLRPSQAVEPRFLFYVLVSKGFIDTINSETFGSKMPRADWEIVGHQPLPLPPLEIQRRIVRFLDERTARIDGLIERKRALLERLAERRQALITRAVTKGLNPAAVMKSSGIDWLGDIPAHWEVKQLRRIRRYMTSGSRDWAAYYAEVGDPFLRMTNVTGQGVELDLSDLRFVSLEGVTEGTRTSVLANDILITITAELGSVAIVRKDIEGAYINQHLALFRPHSTICSSDFLVNFLSTDMARAQFLVSGQGGTKQGLGFEQVNNVILGFPPRVEQEEIATFCTNQWRGFEATERPLSASIDRLTEYRSAIITAAVTGKIEELQ